MKNTTDHKSMEQTTTPKLSIIIPAYNVETFLPKCLDSVLAQNFTDWEAIIVDDGSTDGTGAICDDYAARDPRFKVIHSPNKGISSARNTGLANAKGEFIGFVDSDDWIEPDMFATLLDDIIKNDADIAKCGYRTVEQNRTTVPTTGSFRVIDGGNAARLMYEDKKIQSFLWDKLYRRSILNVRFPQGRVYEDMYVLLQVLANARKITVNPTPLYNYRQRKNSIVHTKTIDNKRQFIEAVCERYHQVIGMNVDGWSDRDKKKVYILTILRTCRDVVRQFPHTPETDAFLEELRSRLSETSPMDMTVLGPKSAFRLLVLNISTSLFRTALNTTHLKRKKKKLF